MKSIRWIIVLLLLLLLSVAPSSAQFAIFQVNTPTGTSFNALPIGAGGQITNISLHSDGTKVIRTDTYGAWVCYQCSTTSGQWSQLVNAGSMPANNNLWNQQANAAGCCGVYEIVVAPSNSSVAYMYVNAAIFVTTNLNACAVSGCPGLTWTQTGFAAVNANPNFNTKFFGPYMAVDPANPDKVYVGTPTSGLFLTTNGRSGASATFSLVAAVGSGNTSGSGIAPQQGAGNLTCFDPTTSGGSQVIYVTTNGTGVYRSADAGTSWTLINSTGMPTNFVRAFCDSNGDFWTAANSLATNLFQYHASAWSNSSNTAGGGHLTVAIAVDPASSGASLRIVTVGEAGQLNISINDGSTWTGPQFTNTRVATDIPYLAWAGIDNSFMSAGGSAFDPSQSNVLYLSSGTGVFYTNPNNANPATAWVSQNAKIEQLVAYSIISPNCAGCPPILTAGDRALWQVNSLTQYPSTYGATNARPSVQSNTADWASGTPTTLVALAFHQENDSGVSQASGLTSLVSVSIASPAVVTCTGCNLASGTPFQFTISKSSTSNALPTGISLATTYFVIGAGLTASSFEFSTTLGGSAVNTSGSAAGQASITTWIPFASLADAASLGGCIAAGSATNYLWVNTNIGGGGPWYTTDSGGTWTDLTTYMNANFGIATSGNRGWGTTNNYVTDTCSADKTTTGAFLLYNLVKNAFYFSSDGGATWAQRSVGTVESASIPKLKSVPGQSGNYFYSTGMSFNTPHPQALHLWKTTNSGASWSSCAGASETWSVGFGAAKPGGSGYPAIYIYGWVSGVGGVWRSDDACATWTQLTGLYPANTTDQINDISGDMNVYGNVYMSLEGSGYVYGKLNFVLKRDLNPAANDNTPMWLNEVA